MSDREDRRNPPQRALRRVAIAAWLAGLVSILALNGWRTDITRPPALIGTAILSGTFAILITLLLTNARARRALGEDEAAFTSHQVQWGFVVAGLLLVAAACLFKLA